ncbi:MAG: hypothetical protein AAF333_02145 [Planctomycetota bacterium]
MSMLPPALPDHNPKRRRSDDDQAFTGPKPRLAGEGPLLGRGTDSPPAPPRVDGQPRLRLVGAKAVVKPDLAPTQGTAIIGTSDPRWVLAVRVAEQLEGTVLPPAKRDRLVRMGKMFGLTAFDANLIIAIVQDQARRGYAPAHCPTAGEPQLRMVPPPQAQRWMTGPRTLLIAGIIVGFIALELVALAWVF